MDDRSIEFEIRSVNEEERTVSGIAIPYDQTVEVGGYKERIERGAFKETEIGSPLYFNHDHRALGTPIGSIIEARDTEAGLEIKARISKTPKGEEVYTLLKDGVLKKFSAGFEPVEHRTDADGTVVRTKAKLIEVSIVPRPAYSKAAVAEVRAAENSNNTNLEESTMTENIENSEVVELREAVNDLERKFAVLGETKNAGNAVADQYRSGGEALKALLNGEDAAKEQFRAFTGATTADSNVQPAWVNRTVKLVEENRDVLNLFSKAPHPGSTSVTLPVLGSATGAVGEQAAEGNDLPYMEVVFSDETFGNKTYGGYSSLSRQAIELGTPGYLAKVLEYQALQYAKATNAAVRAALVAATGTATASLSADTFAGWADLVVDSAAALSSNGSGVEAEFMLVSTGVFKRLAHLTDSAGRPLMVVNGDGQNSVGNANVKGLRGSILGLPVVVDGGAAANTCIITNGEAVTVMESSGAPVRLSDENVINLTKDFSLYGYMIVGVTNKLAVVKVDADLVA